MACPFVAHQTQELTFWSVTSDMVLVLHVFRRTRNDRHVVLENNSLKNPFAEC